MEQEFENGWEPVCFASKTLNPAQKNYAADDLELLGIVKTLREWHCYLHRRKFVVHRDHSPLKHLETQPYLSPQQFRWLEKICQFDFDIIIIKGKSNRVADTLSRQISDPVDPSIYARELLKRVIKRTSLINAISTIVTRNSFHQRIISDYNAYSEFRPILKNPPDTYYKINGILYKWNKMCVPKGEARSKVLHDYHFAPYAGHLGESRTLNKIIPYYY